MALWTEPAFEQDGKCRKCVMLPSCQGIHCPLIRIQDGSQPCVSDAEQPQRRVAGNPRSSCER